MKIFALLLILIMLPTIIIADGGPDDDYLNMIADHLIKMDDIFDGRWPEYTIDGKYKYRDKVNWLSGFTGGGLWNLSELTGNDELKQRAIKHADALIEFAGIDYTHDMGFIFMPTVVKAYEVTGDSKYRHAGIQAARMLAKRFNSNGNFLRAWGKLGDPNKSGWMIIDTMMNLELLFWAWQQTGDYELYDIAYKHAITCMKESVRDDFSTHHVIEFDPGTGEVIKKRTHQGLNDESTWARGQAWGIYGFANVYKYTGDERFLRTSQKMADVFIQALPNDLVPYWDLTLSGAGVVRDASAGAIAASGMYLLADVSKIKDSHFKYINYAELIAESIFKNYSFLSSKREEEGLLIHTVYNYHKDWGLDESYTCGDFYFTELLKKYVRVEKERITTSNELRSSISLNENWFYLEDNAMKISDIKYSEIEWEKIDIPHSWNKFDAVDAEPGYRRDAGWYGKGINFNEIVTGKLYRLYFEGVNISCDVYVNDNRAGGHIGGYVGFEVDITEFIHKGHNELLIRVDNSINKDIIPSQLSDFFIYGGITRDVWLKIVSDTHIEGLHISTPSVSHQEAATKININVSSSVTDEVTLLLKLNAPDGNTIIELDEDVELAEGDNSFSFDLEVLEYPELWSVSDPNLYTVDAELVYDGDSIDKVTESFGYRWYEFKENGPFFLNGERLLLRGTHRHEDYAGMANALPNELHRKDMEMIKEMGANFVRLAHYPQDPEVYKACDELGLLVWDELPWCRGGVGNEIWKNNTRRLFREMIDQNYNHPSIILWSVGNEVYWLPEREGGGSIDNLRSFTKELHDIAHTMDPYRLTSIRKFYEGYDIVDVFSPSIWSGWYSGVYKNYGKAIADAQNKYVRFFHAEYGGSSHTGRHTENPIDGEGLVNPDEWAEAVNQVKVKNIAKIGDWSESYIVDLFDWHLQVSESHEDFTGNAQWAFKDFGTPLRPENSIPYINQKGLVDRAGNPKDAYYVFKSYWNDEDYFTYIESHTWKERSGPKGKSRQVNVFSNCDEVELIINRTSLGIKKRDVKNYPACGLSWDVTFNEGNNEIIAVGYEEGSDVTEDNLVLNYTYTKSGKPEKFVLSSERLQSGNYKITIVAVDENNMRCIDYQERVYVSSEGKGTLIENYGIPGKSSVIEMANGKAEIEFKPIPFEKSIIEARNQNFKGDYLIINGVSD